MTVWFLELFNVTEVSLLECITGAISTGALVAGTYSFINPQGAARIYGIPTYDLENESSASLIFGSRPPADAVVDRKASADGSRRLPPFPARESDGEALALVHSLGARNVAVGLTVAILTTWWSVLKTQGGVNNVSKMETLRTALGIVILVGVFVPVVDAWVCLQHSCDVYQRRVALYEREVKDRTSVGGLWEGHQTEFDAYITSKRAGQIHVARTFGWMVGALYCLF